MSYSALNADLSCTVCEFSWLTLKRAAWARRHEDFNFNQPFQDNFRFGACAWRSASGSQSTGHRATEYGRALIRRGLRYLTAEAHQGY